MSEKNNSLIWVVDDNPMTRKMIATKLASAGYHNIREFKAEEVGGQEAISRLDAGEKPDLLITDNDMPNVNGISVLISAQKHGVKAIMFSARSDLAEQAEKLGAVFCEKRYIYNFMNEVEKSLSSDILQTPHNQSNPPEKPQGRGREKL